MIDILQVMTVIEKKCFPHFGRKTTKFSISKDTHISRTLDIVKPHKNKTTKYADKYEPFRQKGV